MRAFTWIAEDDIELGHAVYRLADKRCWVYDVVGSGWVGDVEKLLGLGG